MGFWKYVLGTPRNYALTLLLQTSVLCDNIKTEHTFE